MRIVLQRVSRAEVRIGDRVAGAIGGGYVLLAAFRRDDTEDTLRWMADKVMGLRLFPGTGEGGRDSSFERDLTEVGGGILVVSQFTLYGDARRGRRPGFTDAAPPEVAVPLYDRFVALLRERAPGPVETGEFGAMMEVDLVNDGPVTLILDR
ncbi:MAG TPA: D-aminoacyl-tRNA deacylase [Longimicrobiales bacterium]|nr:D-aminoacyl-tRNA deacylase [Longimicrobiales bacterium]